MRVFQRLRWMLIGTVAGAAGSWWTRRKARQAAAQLRPEVIGRRVVDQASTRAAQAREGTRHRLSAGTARVRERLGR